MWGKDRAVVKEKMYANFGILLRHALKQKSARPMDFLVSSTQITASIFSGRTEPRMMPYVLVEAAADKLRGNRKLNHRSRQGEVGRTSPPQVRQQAPL